MSFNDLFSTQAVDYAKYRPHYPTELFAYLAGLCSTRDMAWDCATGNGQAALGLAPLFKQVVATDASAKQIERVVDRENITYSVAMAEDSKLGTHSVDLITVAQALHWFDFERFYAEAKRVLRPEGVLACWTYGNAAITSPLDQVIGEFYRSVVGPYWPAERKYVEDGYRSIPFPFTKIEGVPKFEIALSWNLVDLLGYLFTWSATQKMIEKTGANPLELLAPKLAALWGDPHSYRRVVWPLEVLVGKN